MRFIVLEHSGPEYNSPGCSDLLFIATRRPKVFETVLATLTLYSIEKPMPPLRTLLKSHGFTTEN
jgi:hypothetical protein